MNSRKRMAFFCSVQYCQCNAIARGLCSKHWQRAKFRGDLKRRPRFQRKTCVVKDCGLKHYCKGFCQGHYNRMKNSGTIENVRRLDKTTKIIRRKAKVAV